MAKKKIYLGALLIVACVLLAITYFQIAQNKEEILTQENSEEVGSKAELESQSDMLSNDEASGSNVDEDSNQISSEEKQYVEDNEAGEEEQDETVGNESSEIEKQKILISENGEMEIYIYWSTDFSSDACEVQVNDKEGKVYDVSPFLESDSIWCTAGMGEYATNFKGWLADGSFLLEETAGEIQIVNVLAKSKNEYFYDSADSLFVGANKTGEYWLFRISVTEGQREYILLDRDKSTILDKIIIDNNDRGVLYDYVNDGFLFISRLYSIEKDEEGVYHEYVSISLDYLSLGDLGVTTLLTTDKAEVYGRGCSSERLLSVPGEIILTEGCLTVLPKYLGEDGNIHITLSEN